MIARGISESVMIAGRISQSSCRSRLSPPLWCPARAEPARHLLPLPRGRGPSQTPPSLATDSSISPGPPSPWLPALPIERRFYRFCGNPWVQPRGCKGRSPRQNKLKISPLPAGKGAGGMGAKSKLKSGAAGNPKGKPPLWIPEWYGQPATSRASPPPGAPTAGRAGNVAAHLPTTVIISCGKCDIFPKIC